jgi:hypothetical protein
MVTKNGIFGDYIFEGICQTAQSTFFLVGRVEWFDRLTNHRALAEKTMEHNQTRMQRTDYSRTSTTLSNHQEKFLADGW